MKLLFLGIDALDYKMIEAFSEDLPNIKRLMEDHVFRNVISTFPPILDTAWATIVTGLNPAQHGVVQFIDPLEKSYQIMNVESWERDLSRKNILGLFRQRRLENNHSFPASWIPNLGHSRCDGCPR